MNKQLILFYYYKFYWFWCLFFCRKPHQSKKGYTIGITTFKERYDILFCDLIVRLTHAFPKVNIIVAVNGNYNQEIQKEYIKQITSFCQRFSNVKIVSFVEPQGLSKLWNQIIINAQDDKIFLFNDDILFNKDIARKIEESGIINEKIALIDNSFSHFMINKELIKKVGWFDERFTEIGGEDDDFHVRLELLNIPLKRYNLNIFKSYKPSLLVNSYGRDTKKQVGGYSTANTNFLFTKWEVLNQPFDGSIKIIKSMGNYWKLKEGMGTPNFYENVKL